MRDLVTLPDGEPLQFNGTVIVEREYTNGRVTALWLTDGIARYLIQGAFSGWLEVYQPREQVTAILEACLVAAQKHDNSLD